MIRPAVLGAAAPFRGAWLLVRHPALWPAAALPTLFGLGWAVFSLLQAGGALLQGGWLVLIVSVMLSVAFALIVVSLQITIALLSPLLDLLAARTERLVGLPAPPSPPFARAAVAAIAEGVKLLGFKWAIALAALPLAFLPGVGPFLFAFAAGFGVAIDFLDYPLARRGWTLGRKRRWLYEHRTAAASFSLVCYALLVTPGLGGLFLTPCVVGGTWLVAELGADASN